ncbi:MAG: hypothetical protein K0B05_07850 [Bacteroidales bacterium]|nr:hypothetical protein [Bacteroidales bacterium]
MGYHVTHDFGGAEGMEEIFSATGGLVVSSNNEVMDDYKDLPGDVRPDVVWVEEPLSALICRLAVHYYIFQ